MRLEALLKDLRTYTQVSTADHEPAEGINAGETLKKALANLETVISEGPGQPSPS